MTHPDDDLFDPTDPQDADTAAWLGARFGVPPSGDTRMTNDERAAIRARILGAPAPTPSPRATGIVAVPATAFPDGPHLGIHRVASLAAAAVLVLVLAATLGAYLRTDDGERLPGAAATASVLPFAPGAALASPAAATCATDATLLLNPAPDADTAALADLPFPVAWYRDGTLTVQDGDEVLREIAVDNAVTFRPTTVPGVVMSMPDSASREPATMTLVNIATGETATIGPYESLSFTGGPYLFWAADAAYTRWNVTDLRTFETVDLSQRFRVQPIVSMRPYAGPLTTSADGSVALVGTTSANPVSATIAPATPGSTDLPPLDVSQSAILIDGSLDDIRLIGPLATTSGAMALSPDGKTVAWLAPSERAGLRLLTIQDIDTGEVLVDQPIDATYSNSLMFSVDGEYLYATHGTTLETIDVHLENGYSLGNGPIELPDTGYRIAAASTDRTKLLLDRAGSAAEETSLWVDLNTDEIRELPGQPSNLFIAGIPGISGPIGRYISLDNPGSSSEDREMHIVDMETGEVVISDTRGDTSLVSVSADGSTLLIPQVGGITVWSATSGSVAFPAPDGVEGAPTMFALSPNGACAAGSWDLEGDAIATVLLVAESGEQIALPESIAPGWVAPGRP